MFLGVVATTKKDINNQSLDKRSDRTIHLCDRANKLTTIVIPNADNLTFGNLIILDLKDDCYKFERLKSSSNVDENLLIQLYNLIENEKLMLKTDEEIFKKNFGDFGKIGEEIFHTFSSRYHLIELLKTKFYEFSLKVNPNNNQCYLKVNCLKIICQMQSSNVDLNQWITLAKLVLNLTNINDNFDKELLINVVESLINKCVDDIDGNELKLQLEQQLKEKLNELNGKQKKLV